MIAHEPFEISALKFISDVNRVLSTGRPRKIENEVEKFDLILQYFKEPSAATATTQILLSASCCASLHVQVQRSSAWLPNCRKHITYEVAQW